MGVSSVKTRKQNYFMRNSNMEDARIEVYSNFSLNKSKVCR